MKTQKTTVISSEVEDAAFQGALKLADGLFAHQVEGVAFLLARRRSILADDMGLGKTL
jgi:SNF2 family DNA or RNA helicase